MRGFFDSRTRGFKNFDSAEQAFLGYQVESDLICLKSDIFMTINLPNRHELVRQWFCWDGNLFRRREVVQIEVFVSWIKSHSNQLRKALAGQIRICGLITTTIGIGSHPWWLRNIPGGSVPESSTVKTLWLAYFAKSYIHVWHPNERLRDQSPWFTQQMAENFWTVSKPPQFRNSSKIHKMMPKWLLWRQKHQTK